ncbi:nuclear transport factor 2 family protein [Cryptosporangium aurantiacum]|uniref:SnoaL-like domain-containing protein n=1 Tax=Cryptosporangium aurantiacum TaxID=134849 RepID=A0A1M7RM68_9ACTN|nr:nuclear transport factor 2 family protein [Cryptosporangium aurantiacum]SHN47289.1 SnoaL-like domain-containing protein [Cryptosporangium aurantiacum]
MATPEELYQRYVYAGAMTRDAEAVAALFTDDGVYEAPLVPPGHPFPRRLAGRDEIRRGLSEYYRRPQPTTGPVDVERTRYVLHRPEPGVLIAEVDTVLVDHDPISLVQIFRVRDGLVASLRDYFDPAVV